MYFEFLGVRQRKIAIKEEYAHPGFVGLVFRLPHPINILGNQLKEARARRQVRAQVRRRDEHELSTSTTKSKYSKVKKVTILSYKYGYSHFLPRCNRMQKTGGLNNMEPP